VAKGISAFRLSDTELAMLDALVKYDGMDGRPEELRWLIRSRYQQVIPEHQRIVDLQSEVDRLREEVAALKEKIKTP
jgi:polyhydroxyalkanoate synthesis regulator phasin